MANRYGSKEYAEWVNGYADGFTFSEEKNGSGEYGNYTLTFRRYIAELQINGIINRRSKARFTVFRNNLEVFSCDCIDCFMTPYFFSRNGITYLFFRKTLYGYTLLNLSDI